MEEVEIYVVFVEINVTSVEIMEIFVEILVPSVKMMVEIVEVQAVEGEYRLFHRN